MRIVSRGHVEVLLRLTITGAVPLKMKPAILDEPQGLVTTTSPDFAVDGTETLIELLFITLYDTLTPPNVTLVTP